MYVTHLPRRVKVAHEHAVFRHRRRGGDTAAAVFNAEFWDAAALLACRALEDVVLRRSGEEEDVSRGDAAD